MFSMIFHTQLFYGHLPAFGINSGAKRNSQKWKLLLAARADEYRKFLWADVVQRKHTVVETFEPLLHDIILINYAVLIFETTNTTDSVFID